MLSMALVMIALFLLEKMTRDPENAARKQNRCRQSKDPSQQDISNRAALQTTTVRYHRTGYGRGQHMCG